MDDLGKLTRLLVDAVGRHVFVELLVREALEDLLERGLAHRVVVELVLDLELLDKLEEEANGLVVAFNAQAHVASVVLDHLNNAELVAHALDHAEQGAFGEDFVRNVVGTEGALQDRFSCLLRGLVLLVLASLAQLQDRLDDQSRNLCFE